MGLFKKSETKPEYPAKPRTTDTVPRVLFKVLYADIPFFRDPECQQRVQDAHLCILQRLEPEDTILERDVVPTFNKYSVGDYVDWSLESKILWEACWFQDPENGQVEKAWNFHVLFEGAVISEQALTSHQDSIKDLEERTFQQLLKGTSPVN